MSKSTPNPTRANLLKAANDVLLEHGVNAVTLEAVAARAGVSKGGLLYHFPSKDALIEGMIAAYISDFDARIESRLAGVSDPSGAAWMRAYIEACLEPDPPGMAVSTAMLAAVAVNPALLRPMREQYARWQAKVDGFNDPTLMLIMWLAMDGLWISDLLQTAPPTEEQRRAIAARLLAMLEERT